jgi:hypothetical protein
MAWISDQKVTSNFYLFSVNSLPVRSRCGHSAMVGYGPFCVSTHKVRLCSSSRGIFSVMQICSRTRIWPACVLPTKNNVICESIVKRDKHTRDAVRGVTPVQGIRMRERAYNFSAHFSARRRTYRIVLTIVNSVMYPAVEFYACGSRVREQICMTLKTPFGHKGYNDDVGLGLSPFVSTTLKSEIVSVSVKNDQLTRDYLTAYQVSSR